MSKTNSYKIPNSQQDKKKEIFLAKSIDYIDDIRLYSRDLRSLAINISTVKKIANTVELNLNEKKCAVWEMKKDEQDYLGKYKEILDRFPKLVESKENKTYKYFGAQQKKFNLKLNKENIHELLKKKNLKICKSNISTRLVAKSMRILIISVLNYYHAIIPCYKKE